jgi:Predicted acetyltransferase
LKIVLEDSRYVLLENTEEVGEITWSNAGEDLIIVDHTFVEPQFRGQGWAEKLVAASVDYARENNKKIIPLCPFAKKEFNEKNEYLDVWKQ